MSPQARCAGATVAAQAGHPAAGVLRHRARLPRPGRRRGRLRGPLHHRRPDRRPRPRARLDRRAAARRRGVADRVDEVLLRPRPRPRLPRDGRGALPAGLGAARRLVDRAGDDRRERRQLDVAARRAQNWVYAWVGFAAAPRFRGLDGELEERLRSSVHAHATYVRDNLTAERNHRTLELYALLVVALALPELDPDGALLDFAMAELHRNLLTDVRGRRRAPRALDPLPPDRAALVPRRARERAPLRPGLRRPATTSGSGGRASSRCTATGPTARSRRCPTATAGATPTCSSWAATCSGARTCATRRPPGARQPAARALRRASRTAATTCSAAAGARAGRAFADERFLIFDCGPLGDGGHGHYDLAQRRDRGRRPRRSSSTPAATPTPSRTPTCATGSRAPRRTTPSASTGSTRRPTGRGKPKAGTEPTARLLERHGAPGLDVAARSRSRALLRGGAHPPRRVRRPTSTG